MRPIGICAAALVLAACGDSGAATETSGDARSGVTAAATTAPSGPAVASESREFREWRATCDNGNACVAFTNGEDTAWLRIGMDAGPDAKPTVMLGVWRGDGGEVTQPPILVIDGRRHATTMGPADTSSFSLPAADVPAVLRELAQASAISVATGDQVVAIPTAGTSASLLWIDDRQGRLNTTTALIRRGDRPASAVPAPPALPVVVPAPTVSQAGFEGALNPIEADGDPVAIAVPAALEALPMVKRCRESTAFNEYVQKAVTASRLDAQTVMWGIPCDSGAYNVMYSYFLAGANGANAHMVNFPDADGRPQPTDEVSPAGLINPVYDPTTRTLTAFSKARGLGDCGGLQTWTWTGRGFVMSREQVMGECWGMVSDFWPTTYRTR